MGGGQDQNSGGRTITYCIVPRDLARKLHEPLRRHFAADPAVEVIVERRSEDRRTAADRRSAAGPPRKAERRRIRTLEGRRIGERRAALVPVEPPPLPRRAQPHAERLLFAERLEPSDRHAEDLDSARLVTRAQAGSHEAFSLLYARYFDRVYSYMRAVLGDAHEAEDATQQVFLRVLEALPKYGQRKVFRAWLFTIVRNHAIDQLRRRGRVDLVEPERLEEREADLPEEIEELPVLDWISDRDLLLLVNRLPLAQRQVILLRYMLDLSNVQIGAILDRSANDVAVLHYRAVGYLRERLAAVGRCSTRGRRTPVRRWVPQSAVLRLRRFALH